jgi:hypothetical protein
MATAADAIPIIANAIISTTRNVFFIIDLNWIFRFIKESLFSWKMMILP